MSKVSSPLPELLSDASCPKCKISPSSFYITQMFERKKKKGKLRRKNLSKAYIGLPSHFKHLCHIGWIPQISSTTNLEPELKMIFAQAGITQDHLKDKRTSRMIFETIEKQGGVQAILKEAKVKGLLTKPLDCPLSYAASATQLDSSLRQELRCQTPRMKNTFSKTHLMASSISESQESLKKNCLLPSGVTSPVSCISPSTRPSQHSLIQSLKEVHLKRANSDYHLTPVSEKALTDHIRMPLKPVAQNQPPWDEGIVGALKDVIQKRHKAMHASGDEDSESDLENEEWDE